MNDDPTTTNLIRAAFVNRERHRESAGRIILKGLAVAFVVVSLAMSILAALQPK